MQYEFFRLAMVGIGPVAAVATIAFDLLPRNTISGNGDLWVIALGIATSAFTGYLLNQIHRLWVTMRRSRRNVTKLAIATFADRVRSVVRTSAISQHVENEWTHWLTDKDLHVYLWVSLADLELRERSESYWERYYTNTIAGFGILTAACVTLVFLLAVNSVSWSSVVVFSSWCLVAAVLLKVRAEYLRVATNFENAWMESTATLIEADPAILNGVLKKES